MAELEATWVGDIRTSPRPLIAAYIGLTVALGMAAEVLGWQAASVPLVILILGLSVAAWLLSGWRPVVGRYLALAIPTPAVLGVQHSLGLHGVLPFLVIPVVLAVPLSGLASAVVVTASESLLVLLTLRLGLHATAGEAAISFVLCWMALGAMAYAYHPAFQLVGWSWQQFNRAQRLLEEARDQRAELKQALADLAAANYQLGQLNRLAQGLRRAAEDARQAKEQFVANVSHELRTPLNMILGFSEMILHAPQAYGAAVPHALMADLEVVLRNSQHLSALIDDVLDLSQVEAGHMSLAKERVSIAEAAAAAASAVRPLYESRGLKLDIDVDPHLPAVFCDRTRIREVLLNLLSNAGRFTDQGGVHVRVRRVGNEVEISVADTGPGIAPQDEARIFRPFEQLDGSIRRRHGGTGLGLAISKSFVEQHGGRMWFVSNLGEGSTFFFRLPIDPPSPMPSGAQRWISPYLTYEERPERPRKAPMEKNRSRYVVVDHSGSLARLLRRYLDNADIACAESLEQACLDLARVPAQALLVNCASVGGGLQQVLQQASLPYGTPAIICSLPGSAGAAEALGAKGYLVKPVSREALLGALDSIRLRGKTILVVDDEPDALQLFRRMLRSARRGYRVLSASDGRQALGIMEQEKVDGLLLDLAMPDMDGFQILAARAAHPALSSIPVIIISARDPAGQPILAGSLAVTRGGGLSAAQLLDSVGALTRALSPMPPSVGRASQATPAD